jgi:hypothetical protein
MAKMVYMRLVQGVPSVIHTAGHASDAEGNGIQAEFEAAGRIEGKKLVKV